MQTLFDVHCEFVWFHITRDISTSISCAQFSVLLFLAMLTLEYRSESINFLVSLCFEFKIYSKGHTILLLARIFLHFVSVVVVGASFVEWLPRIYVSFCYLGLMFAIWVKSFRKKTVHFHAQTYFYSYSFTFTHFMWMWSQNRNSRYYVMSCQYTTHIHFQCIAAAKKNVRIFSGGNSTTI